MNEKEKFELIKRNTEEILTEESLKALLKKKEQPTVYCGYEISGPVHLGHFVTIIKLIDLQKAGFKIKILLADVHTMLNKKTPEATAWKKTLKAIGMKADFILGSSFQYNKEYQLDVLKLAQKTTINRGLRSMQEVARDIKNATISQIIYPLMQIIDIKHLKADASLGGMDQRKIYALGKDEAKTTNHNFVAIHTPLITSLKGPDKTETLFVEELYVGGKCEGEYGVLKLKKIDNADKRTKYERGILDSPILTRMTGTTRLEDKSATFDLNGDEISIKKGEIIPLGENYFVECLDISKKATLEIGTIIRQKMSSSIPGSNISITDSKEEIKKTINRAYCPTKETKDNPILQIAKLIIFPKLKEIKISRPEKFGGNVEYKSYEGLEKDFSEGKLHPADLKQSIADSLEKIISPIRNNFR